MPRCPSRACGAPAGSRLRQTPRPRLHRERHRLCKHNPSQPLFSPACRRVLVPPLAIAEPPPNSPSYASPPPPATPTLSPGSLHRHATVGQPDQAVAGHQRTQRTPRARHTTSHRRRRLRSGCRHATLWQGRWKPRDASSREVRPSPAGNSTAGDVQSTLGPRCNDCVLF
jgi:hypothetical protein